ERQQIAHDDRPRRRHGIVEGRVDSLQHFAVGQLGQQPIDRVAQPQLAFFDQDHRRRGRDRLGQRRDAEDRVAPHRLATTDRLHADRVDMHLTAPAHQRDQARHFAALDIARHDVAHVAKPRVGPSSAAHACFLRPLFDLARPFNLLHTPPGCQARTTSCGAIRPSVLSKLSSSQIRKSSHSGIVAPMQPIIAISNLSKTYASGFQALKHVSLDIRRGEIFALLGPNGAGKTTLISIVCGIVNRSEGNVLVNGHDIVADYRAARSMIGLVPQELTTDAFESVWGTVSFSRGLFGKAPNPAHIEKVLRDLSLWDRKDSKVMTLSGGMKRRLLIAKALSHEPQILFLDEPTAGVDVNLRRDMWQLVRTLRAS